MLFGPRFQAAGEGAVRVRLTRPERALLRPLPARLRERLADAPDDPALRRLFPPAYEDDPEGDAEYRRLVGDELASGRLERLATMERTLDDDRLSAGDAEAWLGALNDLRLELGTRLGVTEETFADGVDRRDPRARELALYGYLTWLQEQLVSALAG